MKNNVAFLLVFLLCSLNSQANNIKVDDRAFYEARMMLKSDNIENRDKGVEILQKMTGRSIQARYSLGWWLLMVKGNNDERGIALISSAATEGNSSAGYFMSDVYKNGMNGKKLKNEKKAVKLLREVLVRADHPSADEEQTLGQWLMEEDEVKNKKEAIYWLERSLNHDNLFAISILVPLLVEGEERDLVKAWFYSDLGGTGMASEKHAIEKQMTPEQLEQAQEMSWQWQDEHHIHVPGYRGQGSSLHWQVESH